MKIQKLIEEQRKSFDEKFSEYIKTVSIGQYDKEGVNVGFLSAKDVIFKWHTDVLRKLIEALGEELINNFMEDLNYYNPGKPPCTDDSPCGCHFGEVFHADGMCLCDIEKKQRLKLKEILSNIK